MLPPQNCYFLFFNRIDVMWTLYEVLSRKLCDPDENTCFFFGRVEFLRNQGWTYGIKYG